MILVLDLSGVWMPTYNNHSLSFCNIATWLIFPLLQFPLFRFSLFRSSTVILLPEQGLVWKNFCKIGPCILCSKYYWWGWMDLNVRYHAANALSHLQTNLATLLFSELQASEIHERSLSTFAMPSDDPVVVWDVASVEKDVHLRRLLPKQSSRSFCHRYRRQRIRWVKKWEKNTMKESTIE